MVLPVKIILFCKQDDLVYGTFAASLTLIWSYMFFSAVCYVCSTWLESASFIKCDASVLAGSVLKIQRPSSL